MESLLDPPAELRFIVRPYLHATQVAAGESPSLALDAYDTTKLQNGAVAMVLNVGYFGVQDRGPKSFFIFRKFETTLLPADLNVTPGRNGGIWIRMQEGSLLSSAVAANGGAVTLTAAAGPIEVIAGGGTAGYPFYQYQLNAFGRIRIEGGATPGAIVVAQLQYSYQVGAPVWVDMDVSPAITLLADEETEISLHGAPALISGVNGAALLTRMICTDTVQTTTVPIGGASLLTNVYAYSFG
jgi:hypothetical protein